MFRLVRFFVGLILALAFASSGRAAERSFDFTTNAVGEPPPGWKALVAGKGRPGEWKVILDDVPPVLAPISPNAPKLTKQAVIAQTSTDPTDERFPMLTFAGDRYGDFTYTVRFKVVGGAVEQIAGIVFRAQNEKNFYVVRASALGNNVKFYKFVDGVRQPAVGPNVEVPRDVWHTLSVETSGNRFRVRFNNKDVIPDITDNSFPAGRIGFFTKSDSQVYFSDPHIVFKPLETVAAALVRSTMERNPRILNLRIFGRTEDNSTLRVLASSNAAELGQPASKTEHEVITRNTGYFGKEPGNVLVTYPLHDKNGEAIGAVKFTLQSFKGQTEANAMARVRPIVEEMDRRIGAARDLTE